MKIYDIKTRSDMVGFDVSLFCILPILEGSNKET